MGVENTRHGGGELGVQCLTTIRVVSRLGFQHEEKDCQSTSCVCVMIWIIKRAALIEWVLGLFELTGPHYFLVCHSELRSNTMTFLSSLCLRGIFVKSFGEMCRCRRASNMSGKLSHRRHHHQVPAYTTTYVPSTSISTHRPIYHPPSLYCK